MRKQITRSRALGALLAAGLLATGVASTTAGASDDNEPVSFTYTSWGGDWQRAQTIAWIEPYMEANPHVTIIQDEPTDYARIQAMVESGRVSWDLVNVENDFGLTRNEELLEPIDCDIVPCHELQPESLITTGYRVPLILWSIVVAYRTDVADWNGEEPQGWADFFDVEKFPGMRTVRNNGLGSGILEGALLADGVDPAELYPLDVERALAKIETIEDHIIWWEVGQQCAQMLVDNEAVMGVCYNGRLYDAMESGAPLAIQWNGSLTMADYAVIPKGTENIDAAMDFLAYITSAEHNAAVSEFISYAPPNINAAANVHPDMEPHLPTTYADVTIFRDDVWLDENYAEVETRFLEWLVS